MRSFIIPTILVLFPLMFSCATAPKKIPMRKDPLIGKIIKGSTGAPVSFSELMAELSQQDVIYLSEKHDNPMHHAIQLRIITDLTDSGHSPIIGFEFFSTHETPQLLNLMDSKKAKHTPKMEAVVETRMRKELGWEDQSDLMWSYYWDLLVLAKDKNLTCSGLDLASAQKRRITRKGLADISPIEKKLLFSTNLSDPVYKDHMTSIFKDVHCGMDHGKMADRLYDTWRARNDQMASTIVQLHDSRQASQGPVVIIMGNGHTEYGLGVLDRVKHLNPTISQANLAMAEIFREPAELETYLTPLDLDGYPPAPPADFLWFTQRVSYEDPCLKFKEALERMKKKRPRTTE